MFDKNSDYAHNRREKDAIVYISVTGTPVILTRADFSSEDEFQRWKLWSDGDYRATEHEGRCFYDNCISLDENLNCICAVPSIEDELIDRINETEHIQNRAAFMEQVKDILTRKQFRRLWMLHVEKMSTDEISKAEGVKHQSISESISVARKNILKFYDNTR